MMKSKSLTEKPVLLSGSFLRIQRLKSSGLMPVISAFVMVLVFGVYDCADQLLQYDSVVFHQAAGVLQYACWVFRKVVVKRLSTYLHHRSACRQAPEMVLQVHL